MFLFKLLEVFKYFNTRIFLTHFKNVLESKITIGIHTYIYKYFKFKTQRIILVLRQLFINTFQKKILF